MTFVSTDRPYPPASPLLWTPMRTKKGAAFRGIVVAQFTSLDGTDHVVIEADHPHFKRTLHVYPSAQCEPWIDGPQGYRRPG